VSIDDMIRDALNNPTPTNRMVDFLNNDFTYKGEAIAAWFGRNLPHSLIHELMDEGMDPGDIVAGVIWAFSYVNKFGVPSDLNDIIEGRN